MKVVRSVFCNRMTTDICTSKLSPVFSANYKSVLKLQQFCVLKESVCLFLGFCLRFRFFFNLFSTRFSTSSHRSFSSLAFSFVSEYPLAVRLDDTLYLCSHLEGLRLKAWKKNEICGCLGVGEGRTMDGRVGMFPSHAHPQWTWVFLFIAVFKEMNFVL